MKVVAVSGGYDPIHKGHIRQFKAARELGDFLIVFLSTDKWLKRKKGFVFMDLEERTEILNALSDVDLVLTNETDDDDVSFMLRKYKPDIFAKGGDRTLDNMPQEELDACKESGIEIVYNVGGGKVQSSSELVKKVKP